MFRPKFRLQKKTRIRLKVLETDPQTVELIKINPKKTEIFVRNPKFYPKSGKLS